MNCSKSQTLLSYKACSSERTEVDSRQRRTKVGLAKKTSDTNYETRFDGFVFPFVRRHELNANHIFN